MSTLKPLPTFPIPREHPLSPPPAYADFRDNEPVCQVKMPDGQAVWVVTKYVDVRTALLDRRLSSNTKSDGFPSYISGGAELPPGFFLNQDPPDHSRVRSLVTREFVLSEMEKLRPRLEAIVDDLLDDITAKGHEADLVTELALPMASKVICELLDAPHQDHEIFVDLTDTVLDRSSTPEEVMTAVVELMAYFDRLVTARKSNPGDDMLSRLAAQEGAGEINHDEFVGLAALLMLSGYDTMAQMIGLGTATLLEHPDQLNMMIDDMTLVPNVVEELLRFLSINHAGLPRAATEDLVIGEQPIGKGDGVLLLINSANRDPEIFEDPDRFDIRRDDIRHLAFGHGMHKCVGLALARVELATVFKAIFSQLPNLRLSEPLMSLPFRHEMVLYGMRRLPVVWDRIH